MANTWTVVGSQSGGLSGASHRASILRKYSIGLRSSVMQTTFWPMVSSTCLGKQRISPIALHFVATFASRNRRWCRSQMVSFFSSRPGHEERVDLTIKPKLLHVYMKAIHTFSKWSCLRHVRWSVCVHWSSSLCEYYVYVCM